jgi:hypothetical protein
MDSVATDCLEHFADSSKPVPFIPASKASLTINGETNTPRYAQRLRQTASNPRICKRLMAHNNWSSNTFSSINWDVPGQALNTLENSAKIVIIKFAHDHLHTRRHKHRIKQAESDKCPACHHLVETDWHILSCPAGQVCQLQNFAKLCKTAMKRQEASHYPIPPVNIIHMSCLLVTKSQ